MTYSRYNGRLNNQWFQLVAALIAANRFNRTLLVPPEVKEYDITKMFEPNEGLWDILSIQP